MIDFSTLQGLTIPEGVVTQIADASGRVLWSAAPKIQFVPIMDLGTTTSTAAGGTYATQWVGAPASGYDICTHALINGELYSLGIQANTGGNFVYNVPDFADIGAINISKYGNGVMLMGVAVGTYTVQLGIEIPEGHALVNITGSGDAQYCYLYIDGTKYTTAQTLAVPIGAVIAITLDEDEEDYADIRLNGKWLGVGAGTHEYTVSRNVTIDLRVQKDWTPAGNETNWYGECTITET